LTLVDTSIWVEFFRGSDRVGALEDLLEADEVLLHPWVLGELVLGGLGRRQETVVADLESLPATPGVTDEEVLELVRARGLAGRGVGWVDVHLLASALVAGSRLWTLDSSLATAASLLGLPPGP
jgi:hypothetical protein